MSRILSLFLGNIWTFLTLYGKMKMRHNEYSCNEKCPLVGSTVFALHILFVTRYMFYCVAASETVLFTGTVSFEAVLFYRKVPTMTKGGSV